MATASGEVTGLWYRRLWDVFRSHLVVKLKRLWVVYRCQRRRNKHFIEIILEGGSKLALNKPVPTAIRKVFLGRDRNVTWQTLSSELIDGACIDQILKRRRLSEAKFFFDSADESVWTEYRNRYPDQCETVLTEAEKIVRHEFNLLGSGPHYLGERIDWHRDPKSGYRWPNKFYTELYPVSNPTNNADVKLPYELSRMQHLPTLGKAYRLTGKESYAQEVVAQVADWLDDNPYLVGVNWTCPMDVAIRIVNIIWALAFIESSSSFSPYIRRRILVSIWQHGRYLVRHLEYSIRPDGRISNHNHYLSNIVGLVYLGVLFPEFNDSQTWRDIGIEGLLEEMERQVHADGVDYESSISYHCLVLEFFTSAALLCRLSGVRLTQAFWNRLEDMYAFTLYVTRPDGKVPQVGDADDGRLHILSDYGRWDPTDHRYLLAIGAALFQRSDMKSHAGKFFEEAFWLLGSTGASRFDALTTSTPTLDSKAFQEAGFYIIRSDGNYLLACCNGVGTGGAGNHKHNDLLSFEFYIRGRAFVVDPGSYVYTGDSRWRNRFRSTSYHNTVMIDGQEQNRFAVNKLFRLTPDAEPIVHQWRTTVDYDWVDAEHTGYHRLSRPVSHRRIFRFDKRLERLQIIDTLKGAGTHTAAWYFHFDHGIDVEHGDVDSFVARADGVTLLLQVNSDSPFVAEIENGWISRSYGVKRPAKILKLFSVFSEHYQAVFDAYCL
jgi:Heparinase II/III-like protein/Heparinase II/III N-terminus